MSDTFRPYGGPSRETGADWPRVASERPRDVSRDVNNSADRPEMIDASRVVRFRAPRARLVLVHRRMKV